MVCYGENNADCMANLNNGMANPSTITTAGTAPKDPAGCMFFNIGRTKIDGNTTFEFATTPLPPPPPPLMPPPECLALSKATCPDHYSYDGIFKKNGVFADGTPYYSRVDPPPGAVRASTCPCAGESCCTGCGNPCGLDTECQNPACDDDQCGCSPAGIAAGCCASSDSIHLFWEVG